MKKFSIIKALMIGVASLVCSLAQAQMRVEISGVGSNQIPIAVAAFANEELSPQLVTSIIRDDLNRSGYFRLIEVGVAIAESATVDFENWKTRGATAMVVGSVQKKGEGRFDVRYKLYDVLKGEMLSGFSMDTPTPKMRLTAHKIADDIYEKLTGIPGVFSTRIAYVTKAGNQYRLEISDADGEGVQVALTSKEPIISPIWSPDGIRVAYVSMELKKPIVYIQNLMTGQRSTVANFKGNNSSPSWSPDGSKLLVTLSKGAIAQIYSINADGSDAQRLSNSNGIDTEGRYSPDGRYIYFVSDRGGNPQIYRMNADGSDVKRMTFKGSYNISPRVSPDGNTLVFISRRDGGDFVYAMDLANSNQELKLSDTNRDESPSFAPNGRYVLYATQTGRRGTLGMVSTDAKVKQKLTIQAGEIREPTWGPFMK
ncbi:Tol-Pal system protein TolB [Undibacterium seohonense]|uniref:Tol-Pal system protein TolB n=1 Tax=Undibacterium seohonense TaxID=1344950 RepID=A0ABR6X498_9BURK|nr:Tol-Pal system beta propeller repeat protein TolB [Undibacterium seohonense]MBC3807770.1 Tol-Pal system protein TolB [Undibacterium seohonense]